MSSVSAAAGSRSFVFCPRAEAGGGSNYWPRSRVGGQLGLANVSIVTKH